RHRVAGEYVLFAHNQVGVHLGDYDVQEPLVIDPVLTYSTFLGGANNDLGFGIAVDGFGNAYVCGQTYSTNFPTANPLQASSANPGDAFVTKFNASGSALMYSTYFGGSIGEDAHGIAVDG